MFNAKSPMKSSPLPVWGEAGRGADGWHIPDPAGQFASSYVGMGNNPVIAVDPDGRWADRIRGIRSTGFELYRYAQWLNQHNYDYINGMFLQRTFPIEYQDPFRDGMDKRREAELEQAILLEKLGIDAEVFGGCIIIEYLFHGSPDDGTYSKSYGSLNAALKDFGYWLDNDATPSQRNDFFNLFQSSEKVLELPSFEDMAKNYPGSLSSSGVYKLIGGKVYKNHLSNPVTYSNSCALRLSRALNYSGAEIPHIYGQTGSGSDGKWYFYKVSDLKNYLIDTYGPADCTGNASDFADKKGIIFFQNCGWSNATGHFDLWNGSSCENHCYWNECNSASMWLLP